MNKDEFDKFVRERYEKEIAWYDRQSNRNQSAYRIFQWTAICLSTLTPFLIVIDTAWTKWLAVGVAVLVAVSVSALKTFKYQENWINYRTTCETLRKEIYFYQAGINAYQSVKDKDALFVERVESLISRENTLWVVTHEKEQRTKR